MYYQRRATREGAKIWTLYNKTSLMLLGNTWIHFYRDVNCEAISKEQFFATLPDFFDPLWSSNLSGKQPPRTILSPDITNDSSIFTPQMLYPTQFCSSNHESTVAIKSQLSEMLFAWCVLVYVTFESIANTIYDNKKKKELFA